MSKLCEKHEIFVREYLLDSNATKAAMRAGYTANNAKSQGHRLISRPDIDEAIVTARNARAKRVEITADMVLQELAKIGFVNMEDFIRLGEDGDVVTDLSKLTRDQAAAISKITVEENRGVRRVKLELLDKRAALVDIGKHLGMFVDRKDLTVNVMDGIGHDELKAIERALADSEE